MGATSASFHWMPSSKCNWAHLELAPRSRICEKVRGCDLVFVAVAIEVLKLQLKLWKSENHFITEGIEMFLRVLLSGDLATLPSDFRRSETLSRKFEGIPDSQNKARLHRNVALILPRSTEWRRTLAWLRRLLSFQ
jgi:hypothetical protein